MGETWASDRATHRPNRQVWRDENDKEKKTKKKKFYWSNKHQEAFEAIKKVIVREVMLAHPDYNGPFEIFTDASTRQLGAVITQKGRPLAFFSRKLSAA